MLLLVGSQVICGPAKAQELVPRAYWPAPTGTNAFVAGYQYSSGDVLTDPSLPIEGVEAELNFGTLTYIRTLDLLDRTANLQLNVPYTWGDAQGFVEGEFRSRGISNIADARARLSFNLLGAPAMDPPEFQALRAEPRPIIGASLLVSMPTGDYDKTRIFNAGSNRWAVKPAVGVIYPLRRTVLFEFEIGAWFFEDNDEFQGAVREQEPMLSTEFHIIKRIRPGFWASLDMNYYAGGRTTVEGTRRDDRQENSRMGATLVWPFRRGHALRLSASTGISTHVGGEFDTVTIAYFRVWR